MPNFIPMNYRQDLLLDCVATSLKIIWLPCQKFTHLRDN